jgi:hypothetical protein
MTTTCSALSQSAGEPLPGTAAERVRAWLAVEVRSAWPRDALDTPELPAPVRQHLAATLAAVPKTRFLALRRDRRGGSGEPIQVFIARLEGAVASLASLQVPDLEALGHVDLAALCRGPLPGELLDPEPLFAVCTHGKRDRCCAEHGIAVYGALSAVAPARTWQCSHLGGHRMSPNLLVLPSGYCYGRVEAADARAIVDAEREGSIYALDHVRGRTYYPRPAQAAEVMVRRTLEERRHAGLALQGCEEIDGERYRVTLATPSGTHVRAVEEREWGPPVLLGSCGDEEHAPLSGWFDIHHPR